MKNAGFYFVEDLKTASTNVQQLEKRGVTAMYVKDSSGKYIVVIK